MVPQAVRRSEKCANVGRMRSWSIGCNCSAQLSSMHQVRRSMTVVAQAAKAAAGMATAAQGPAPKRVAVIGGGMAGLSAAGALLRHDVAATVFDMGGRGVGGRLASRELEPEGLGPFSFDHGAQFFTASSPEFRQQVANWQAAGIVQEWQGRHARITSAGAVEPRGGGGGGGGSEESAGGFCGSLSGQPLYTATPTNNALARHMAAQLGAAGRATVQAGVIVQAVECSGGGCGGAGAVWRLRGSRAGRAAAGQQANNQAEDLGSFDALVLADAMPLLPGSAGHIPSLAGVSSSVAQLATSVQAAAPSPCFALMVAFSSPLPGVPFDSASCDPSGDGGSSDASSSSSSAAFQWVACNSSKPGRPRGAGVPQCWVALTSPQRAARLLAARPTAVGGSFQPQDERYRADVAAQLLADFRAFMQPHVEGALPEPVYCHAQRWGRAFVAQPLGAEFLFLPSQGLALCGDAAAGSNVEAAWRSGRAAGQAVAALLRQAA